MRRIQINIKSSVEKELRLPFESKERSVILWLKKNEVVMQAEEIEVGDNQPQVFGAVEII